MKKVLRWSAIFIGVMGALSNLPAMLAGVSFAGLLGHADHSLSDWDETHSRFPSDEQELREALAIRPLREPAVFFVGSHAIPYDTRIVTNAIGPALEPVPPKPGTIVYAVTSDQKEY